MGIPFLSDSWFDALDEQLARAGNPRPKASDTVINLSVITGRRTIEIAIQNGLLTRCHQQGAPAALTMPVDTAYAFLIEHDPTALMTGIYAGTVEISGDIEAVIDLKAARRSPALQKCLDVIVAKTAPPGKRPSAGEKRATYELAAKNLTRSMKQAARKNGAARPGAAKKGAAKKGSKTKAPARRVAKPRAR